VRASSSSSPPFSRTAPRPPRPRAVKCAPGPFGDRHGPLSLAHARPIPLRRRPRRAAAPRGRGGGTPRCGGRRATARLLPSRATDTRELLNVVERLQNALVTREGVQYAAFYAADATLVLARRGQWGATPGPPCARASRGTVRLTRTRTAAIAVDGEGVLHVAWDQSRRPPQLPRGRHRRADARAGGSDDREAERPRHLTRRCLRLPTAACSSSTRDGSMRPRRPVLHRYERRDAALVAVQARLVTARAKRQPYSSAVLDRQGVLHLAWVWRDSPPTIGVPNQRPSAYAAVEGRRVTGRPRRSPPGAAAPGANAEYALRIPRRALAHEPAQPAVDEDGQPISRTTGRQRAATSRSTTSCTTTHRLAETRGHRAHDAVRGWPAPARGGRRSRAPRSLTMRAGAGRASLPRLSR
jgi:hypothetical protein